MSEPSIGIAAVGTYIPRTYITAAEIAAETGIPEHVIASKFGLTRKPVPGPDDHTNAMALWAAQDALAGSDIAPDEIDVVLCTTEEWKEYPLWTAGIKLAYDLGARRAWAIDVQMRCGTTIGALKLARSLMLAEPDVKTVLIAGGYRNGDLVDYADPHTRFLNNLAAGGGAALVQRAGSGFEILGSSFRTDGSFSEDVIVPVGGTRRLQFRLELYNAFNADEWTNTDTSAVFDYQTGAQTDANFGRLTGATQSARRIQLGVRFTF